MSDADSGLFSGVRPGGERITRGKEGVYVCVGGGVDNKNWEEQAW